MKLVLARALLTIEKVVLVIESKGLRAGPAFVLSSEVERKEALTKSRDPIGVAEARTSGPVDLVFNRQTGFFECGRPFTDKPMAITKPAVPSAQLLGLGSKQFISNNYLMYNIEFTPFVWSLCQIRQNRESQRKALPAGCGA